MRQVKMDGWVRVSKHKARALYEAGHVVYATNCKLIPANHYVWFWLEQRPDEYWPDHLYPTQFDYVVATWTMYNANYEWGYYPAFYVKEGTHNAA